MVADKSAHVDIAAYSLHTSSSSVLPHQEITSTRQFWLIKRVSSNEILVGTQTLIARNVSFKEIASSVDERLLAILFLKKVAQFKQASLESIDRHSFYSFSINKRQEILLLCVDHRHEEVKLSFG